MIHVNAGETLDVFGPRVSFLPSLDLGEAEFTLIAGVVDPGVIVPLHSHPDQELFSIKVAIEVFVADQRHAHAPATCCIFVTEFGMRGATSRSCGQACDRHHRALGTIPPRNRPSPCRRQRSPSPSDIERLISTSKRYGYWNGSPDDNAAIELTCSMILDVAIC